MSRIESLIDPMQFGAGYADGWNAGAADDLISQSEFLSVPSDYNRGFMKGFGDGKLGYFRTLSNEPYNEVVLDLREKYPEEFPDFKCATCARKWITGYADAAYVVERVYGHPARSDESNERLALMLALTINPRWDGRFRPFCLEIALDGSWMRVTEHWEVKRNNIPSTTAAPTG